ncbi:MAG: hypothetical protein DYG98_08750 [Haliscomenobacteraceae bacterium CHB4]|nr:hypothetical protein [Saprospiraceae bacterium]MCE7923134.1 hypothetical protein [Haliscomenobacteraceae bacterium CHB4]
MWHDSGSKISVLYNLMEFFFVIIFYSCIKRLSAKSGGPFFLEYPRSIFDILYLPPDKSDYT